MTARLGGRPWWRRRRVAWAAAGTAVVLAAGGIVYVIGPWRTPPVLRPAGLATVARTAVSIDLGWSGPSSGPAPDTYVILRDGDKVGTVPGSATSFDDKGLTPATSYGYRVIAYRGGHRSKSSALSTIATVTPPAADGVLDSDFTVSQQMSAGDPDTTSWFQKSGELYIATDTGTWTDDWSFTPDASCSVGPCEATLSGSVDGYDFTMDLTESGGTYSGTIDIGDNWYCGSNSEYSDTTLLIQLTPETAGLDGTTWEAQSFAATGTWMIPADADGACGGATFSFEGSGAPS
jgi:hypothetical protein